MPTVLITGGTGLIGRSLTKLLVEKNYKVIILTRKPIASHSDRITYAAWDVNKKTIDENAISAADYIVHLAGEGVAEKRWTEKRKKEIVESRTQSSELVVNALKKGTNHVKAVISASAIGWYGDDKDLRGGKQSFTEEMPAATDFLGETCRLWEQSIEPVTQSGKRLVKVRTGIVLGKDGGAFPEFKKPVTFGVAAILGSGGQTVSWIHVDDLCRMYLFAIEHENINGAYNGVAPIPVTNKELTLKIAKKIKGKFHVDIHVPAFALKLIMGEISTEVLKNTTVSGNKIREAGFTFIYPSIEAAINNLAGK